MTLREKQVLFAQLVARLLIHAEELGYEITFGEAYRLPSTSRSVHPLRLAIDLNLFLNGRYLTETADHAPLGAWWKEQHSLCRWGGDFKRRDGNHYSIAHKGQA